MTKTNKILFIMSLFIIIMLFPACTKTNKDNTTLDTTGKLDNSQDVSSVPNPLDQL